MSTNAARTPRPGHSDRKKTVEHNHDTHLNVFQTTAYTNKYNLPDNSRAREILMRRHQSIRRSIRAGSFREQVGFISTEL